MGCSDFTGLHALCRLGVVSGVFGLRPPAWGERNIVVVSICACVCARDGARMVYGCPRIRMQREATLALADARLCRAEESDGDDGARRARAT